MRNKVPTAHNLMSLSEFAHGRLPETPPSSNSNIFSRDSMENTAVRLSEHINEVSFIKNIFYEEHKKS